jgi:hypothetical protein
VEYGMKEKVRIILNKVNSDGLEWKIGKGVKHLKTRKEYGHIPDDFSMRDYENVIMNDKKSDVYQYFVKGFHKVYIVFGDGKWIVIIGEDGMMETSFRIDSNYCEYLSRKKGYEYLGKVEEVFE